MCKCCQHCIESCYWHLIEEKFCFDESIAMYEEPVKKSNEKNNNLFDNMAFYDSVSVIAGRAIVTIDPLPEKKTEPVMEQPRQRLKWPKQNSRDLEYDFLKAVPFIVEENSISDKENKESTDGTESETQQKLITKRDPRRFGGKFIIKKSVSFHNITEKTSSSSNDEDEDKPRAKSENLIVPEEEEVSLRRKSLRERRMSKSLSLKIDFSKELPIIRQNSMPKFYLDTPEENQIRDSALVRNSSSVFKSPMATSNDFNFDLYSVVQIEKNKSHYASKALPVPVHRESSRLNLIKEKIMLKKSKSTVSASTLPYSNHI